MALDIHAIKNIYNKGHTKVYAIMNLLVFKVLQVSQFVMEK